MQQVDERPDHNGKDGRRDRPGDDEGIVIGADALIDKVAQTAQTDHGRQHSPAHGVHRRHPQPRHDGGHGQRQLYLPQGLERRHPAAPGSLQILRLHAQDAGVRIFQDREHGVNGQGDDNGGGPHPQPQKQHADEHQSRHRLEHGHHRQQHRRPPGRAAEQHAQRQPQHKACGHADQHIGDVDADGLRQHGAVNGKECSHRSSPHRVVATDRATLVLVTMPAMVSSLFRTTT